jgi:uncharacterized protein (TIGR02231 family)
MKNLITIVLILHSVLMLAQKPIFTNAKINSATVYFNGAEISETATAFLPKGSSELVVKNVSDYTNESTVQIATPASVTVLSVQFTKNYISEYELDQNNPDTKKVQDSIDNLSKNIQKLEIDKKSIQKTLELLDKNQQVYGNNTGLNLIELTKMIDYFGTKNIQLNNQIVSLDEKITQNKRQLDKLKNRLEIKTQNEVNSSKGKLVIQLMNETAGNIDFKINYLTAATYWKPFYELKANSINEPIALLYKGEVIQNTGLDWKNVKLSLSSGNPNQSNQAPELNPWFLQYQNMMVYARGYKIEQDEVMMSSADAPMESKVDKALRGKLAGVSTLSNYTTIAENQLNVSFDIDLPYDIMSNGKPHSIALKSINIPANYSYFAAPKLDKEAFLMAEINDYSKYNLLQGNANIIFEGLYVGKTSIVPNQTKDTLSLSMGRDKKIAITREKVVDKSGTKFLSAYKEQIFTYDITVRNNKKEAINITINDQYPISTDKEIEVELLQKDKAKVNTETGLLTWDLKLKPAETEKIRISYKVKYPKDKTIDNLN